MPIKIISEMLLRLMVRAMVRQEIKVDNHDIGVHHFQKNNKLNCIPFVEQTVSPEGSSATEG